MLSYLLRFFSYFYFKAMDVILGKRDVEDMNDYLRINIKSGVDKSVTVDVNPKWTIATVKEKVAPKISLEPQEIRVIFAGQELDDSIVIEDCDLGEQSIVHVVKAVKTDSHQGQSSKQSLIADVFREKLSEDDIRVSSCAAGTKKIHFYVYCSTCKNIKHGKLRVICSKCKQGTLTVSQDPHCWKDVLEAGRISGECQAENCDGNIAEFYFKCFSHPSTLEDFAVALYLVRPNLREIPCLACMEISSPVLTFECAKSHNLCLSCFQLYCISRLNERRFIQHETLGYSLPCPVGCENSLIKETHHFRLVGDEQYARYQQFAAEECLLQAGGVLCPQPGCGAGIIPDDECRKITCLKQNGQGCGFVFCKNCLQGYHLGECLTPSTSQNQQAGGEETFRTERDKWDDASKVTIKVMTKPCPKCRTPTERDGGCMHMVCGRSQCGFNWCWLCQEEWTRDCMGNHWFG